MAVQDPSGVLPRNAAKIEEYIGGFSTPVVILGNKGIERVASGTYVEVEGEVRTEYAISLSIAGVGLASSRRIQPNTRVKVRFALDASGPGIVEAEGRAVHMRPAKRENSDYEVGVFFYPLAAETAGAIQAEVARHLDAWAAASQLDSEKSDLPA